MIDASHRGIRPWGRILCLCAWLAAGAAVSAEPAGDPVNGKTLYEDKCGACHSVEANRIGPMHRGVVGRVPGTAPGFAYSRAVKRLKIPWSPERIDLWLQDPQKVAPGTKMVFEVDDPAQRRDIIAYLITVSPVWTKR